MHHVTSCIYKLRSTNVFPQLKNALTFKIDGVIFLPSSLHFYRWAKTAKEKSRFSDNRQSPHEREYDITRKNALLQVRRRRRCPRPPSSHSNSGERRESSGANNAAHLTNNTQAATANSNTPAKNGSGRRHQHQSTSQRKNSHERRQLNANRRRYEDNLAVIFMGIVLFFLVSHSLRICMGIQEVLVFEQSSRCQALGQSPFQPWALIAANISHLLLVINSSINSLIYCCFSSRFRAQVVKYARNFAVKVGLRKKDEVAWLPSYRGGLVVEAANNENATKIVEKAVEEPLLEDYELREDKEGAVALPANDDVQRRNGLTQTTAV